MEPKKIRLVHSFQDKEAEWVLMEAVYQGREDLKILPPLTVYQEKGIYSPQIRELLGASPEPTPILSGTTPGLLKKTPVLS